MIRRISSDLSTFKSLEFKPGLNILLADKSEGASDRQSRNGAGKTSLIELIHFIFGSRADVDSIFRSDKLIPWTFEIDFDLAGAAIIAGRTGGKPSQVRVQGDCSGFLRVPKLDKDTGDQLFALKEWTAVLGAALFRLSGGEGEDEGRQKYAPSFRTLFSYFVRRQTSGGFIAPHRQAEKQQTWDQQVNLSYLFDLDASIPARLEALREREGLVKELKKAAKSVHFGALMGTSAELRTKLTIAEARVSRMRDDVARFQVLPEYDDLEKEASRLTREINRLVNDNTQDRTLIGQLENALADEQPPEMESVAKLYEEAGVILAENVTRRFEEVAKFHKAVLANRRAHLTAELDSARKRIDDCNADKQRLDQRRAEIMALLNSGGALSQFSQLQEEVGRAEADAATLRQRLAFTEQIETTKAEIDIERATVAKALQDDHHERKSMIEKAILLFEDLSNALYERAGSLYVEAGRNGPEFGVKIDAARSQGIKNMQIFCFDLMLAELTAERGIGPGFLVHDSHLFDGVDERQVAKAVQLGAERSLKAGFQYIITMNSDAIPKEGFRRDFKLDDYLLPVRLTDETEAGGLFGFRFN